MADFPLAFEWAQPETFARRFELTSNGQFCGSVEFQRALGSLATATFGRERWTFKRTGFFSPRITIRREGEETEIAVFTPVWSGGGTLELAGGRRYKLGSSSFWGRDWVFEDEAGHIAVSLHGPTGFLKSGGTATVDQSLPETPLLLCLLWYIQVLMAEDAAATTATIITAG